MSTFLDACHGRPVGHTPAWLMRQAGRYQPEYREIRSRVSFLELCKTPKLAADVTVLAAEQLGADAGIIFADILLILDPLGIPFDFKAGEGPRILSPVRSAEQIEAVAESIDPNESLGYVMEAIRQTKSRLDVPLIGFSGAPFTLASYCIEGGGSKNYFETKKIMHGDPALWDVLMTKLSDAIGDYLLAQAEAGADALQLFDSWAGCLSERDYRRSVFPYVKRIFDKVGGRVPTIHFGTGHPELYRAMHEAGGDVMGVDWRVDMMAIWDALGPDARIMGNLDPSLLLVPEDVMRQRTTELLERVGDRPGHIFNLGHGIMPAAKPPQVRALVDHVHEVSAKLRA